MEQTLVKATHRDVIGKQVKALRRAGKLPAILYGSGVQPTPILLDMHEARPDTGPSAKLRPGQRGAGR